MKVRFSQFAQNLSKKEQKTITGGLMDTMYSSCRCNGCTGAWEYNTPGGVPRATVERDVATYCSCGSGICTKAS